MMKKERYRGKYFCHIRTVMGLVITGMLLAGCGSRGNQEGQGDQIGQESQVGQEEKGENSAGKGVQIVDPDPPVRYEASFTDLDFPQDAYLISNQGSMLYGMSTDEESGGTLFFGRDLAVDEPVVEFAPAVEGYETARKEVIRFASDSSGSLYVLWNVEEEGGDWGYVLSEYSREGEELKQRKIAEPEVCAEIRNIYNIVADDEGRFYLFGISHIFLYDEEGEYQGEVSGVGGQSGGLTVCASGKGMDGKVYFTRRASAMTNGEWELVEVDFEGKKTGAVYKGFPEILEGKSSFFLVAGREYDFLVNDMEYLYGYRMQNQTTVKILKWSDVRLSGRGVLHFCELEDGDILAVEKLTGIQLARLSGAGNETAEKEIVTLGITADGVSDDLKNKIAQYNRMQDTCQVELKVYGDKTYTYNNISEMYWNEEGVQAMTLELVSGKGPDLIAYNGNFPIYAEKGLLEDLSGYLEESEVLSREDYLENALDMLTFSDRLVALPTYFYLYTVYGYSDQVGETRGLDMEQFLDVAGKYDEIPPFEWDSLNTLIDLCRVSVMNFIDMENGSCSFDSEEFQNLLEFIKNAPPAENSDNGGGLELGRDYLLKTDILAGLRNVTPLRASKRPVTLIGYPTPEGEGTYMYLFTNYGCAGISSNSQHKESAWAFLEYLYSAADEWMPAFPARISLLEESFQEEVGTTQKIDDEEYTITEEDVEYTMELIRNALPNPVNLYAATICDIIYEEATAYLEGDKPVEEVTDIIQNRVQLYLNEQF